MLTTKNRRSIALFKTKKGYYKSTCRKQNDINFQPTKGLVNLWTKRFLAQLSSSFSPHCLIEIPRLPLATVPWYCSHHHFPKTRLVVSMESIKEVSQTFSNTKTGEENTGFSCPKCWVNQWLLYVQSKLIHLCVYIYIFLYPKY